MDRLFTILASVMGFCGVAIGAFGAHGLKGHFQEHPDLHPIFKTGVEYHLYHALALLAVACLATRFDNGWTRAAGYLFAAGIVVFSGSLYALSISGMRFFGAITPLGGVSFLAGWVCLLVCAVKGVAK